MLFAILIFIASAVPAADMYVFCGTNNATSGSPRPLPVQGVSLTSGKVLVGLPARSRVEIADCGWFRVSDIPRPVSVSNELYRLVGYRRDGLDAVPVFAAYIPKARPVEYSRRLLYREFMRLGVWDKVQSWMQAQGVWEDFLFATTLESDDALMVGAIKALPSVAGITDAELKEVLSRCVAR